MGVGWGGGVEGCGGLEGGGIGVGWEGEEKQEVLSWSYEIDLGNEWPSLPHLDQSFTSISPARQTQIPPRLALVSLHTVMIH